MNRIKVLGMIVALTAVVLQAQADDLNLLQPVGSTVSAGSLSIVNQRSQVAQVNTFIIAYYEDANCEGHIDKLSPISQSISFAANHTQQYSINAHIVSEYGPSDRTFIHCVRVQVADPDQPTHGNPAQYAVTCGHGRCAGQNSATMTY